MSEPPRLFFTGNSLEQAVLTAAQHYGCEPDDLAYERVERRYGFLRVRRNVVIKVDPKNPVRKRRPAPESVLAAEAEESEAPQLETQHDFNLHREPPRTALDRMAARAPGQASKGQRERPGGQREQGAGRRERGGGQRGQRDHGQPRGHERRAPGHRGAEGQRGGRGGFQAGRPRGAEGAEERSGGRRRRRRRGGGRSGGERRAEAPVLEFVPVSPELPRAEGEMAELVAGTASSLAALAGLDVEVEVYQGERELEVELHGPDEELLFEDEGRLLLAIQHLLPRSLQGEDREAVGVRVDSRGFRSQRVSGLERMAREAADEVRRQGRPKTLHAMNPSDRRTVHLALKEAEDVVTESNGEGFYKRVTIRPA